jgi:hypothetical protein
MLNSPAKNLRVKKLQIEVAGWRYPWSLAMAGTEACPTAWKLGIQGLIVQRGKLTSERLCGQFHDGSRFHVLRRVGKLA